METMAGSAGAADKEMDIITNSLEYKINALKETFTGVWQNIFNRDDLGAVIDFGTGFANVLDGITEKLGLFGTAASAISIASIVKNFDSIKEALSGALDKFALLRATGSSFGGAALETASYGFSSLASSIGLTTGALSGFIAVAAGVAGVMALIDLFTESFDEAREKADQAIETYESNKQQLDDVNSQLETTQQRMNELRSQGGLTFVEQAELSNLETANEKLLAQKAILEEMTSVSQEVAAREAANVLTKKEFAGKEIYQPGAFGGEVLVGAESLDVFERFNFLQGRIKEQTDEYNNINSQLLDINAEKKEINDRLEQYTDEEKRPSFWGNTTPYEKDKKALEDLNTQQEALIKRQGDLSNSIQSAQSELLNVDQIIQQYAPSLLDAEGNVVSGGEKAYEEYEKFYLGMESDAKKAAAKNQQAYDNIINSRKEFQDQYKELVEKAKSQSETGGLTADDLVGYDDLVKEMSANDFSIEDIVMNVNAKAEIINKDELKSQVENQLEESITALESDNESKINSGVEVEFDVEQAKRNKDKILEVYDQLPVESQKRVADYLKTNTDWQGLDTSQVEDFVSAIVNGSENAAEAASNLTGTLQDLSLVFNDNSDLSKSISKYKEQMSSLVDARDKWNKGELSIDDMTSLQQSFLELNGYDMSNFGEGIDEAMSNVVGKSKEMDDSLESSTGIIGEFERAIANVGGENTPAGQALVTMRDNLLSMFNQTEEVTSAFTKLKDTLSTFTQYQSDVSSALKSSVSATGLSIDQVQALQNAYQDLGSYKPDKLFEKTANGIHLNEEEFKRLNSEIQNSTLLQMYSDLSNKYDELNDARARGDDTSGLEKDIADAQMLIAQYEGLTSALYAWQNAQSNGNERDSFESVAKGYESMKEILDQGWYGDESLNAYLDLMLSASERTGDAVTDFEKLGKTIEGTGRSLKDYFSFEDGKLNTDGLEDFLDDVNTKLGDSFSSIDEEGNRTVDFTGEKLQQVADAFGTTTEFVELMGRAMVDAGMKISFADTNLSTLKETLSGLQQEGKISSEIDLDFDTATASLEEFDELLSDLNDEKVRIEAEFDGSEEMTETLETIDRSINTINSAKIKKSIELAVDNGTSIDDMLAMDDTTLQATLEVDSSQVDEARAQLESLNGTTESTTITVQLESSQFDKLTEKDESVTATVTYETDTSAPDSYQPEDKEATVVFEKDSSIPDGYQPSNKSATVNYVANTSGLPSSLPAITRTVNYVKTGDVSVDGTAHVDGTAFATGTAFANGNRSGNWGTRRSGSALGGELGEELIVRDGRYFTIGADGAEFFKYRKDDINKIVSLYSDVYAKFI